MNTQPTNNGLATASLTCGVLAIAPVCCLLGPIGIPLALIAVVTGVVAMQQINASGGSQSGKQAALVGLICGSVALALDGIGIAGELLRYAR